MSYAYYISLTVYCFSYHFIVSKVTHFVSVTVYCFSSKLLRCKKVIVTKAVILLACTQIHKYATDSFSSVQSFFTFATIFCVFVFVQKLVSLVNIQIHITNQPDIYLCVCKIIFVAQIKVQHGTFICV
jgi:hypothetical protein